jgi:hypothetical protein
VAHQLGRNGSKPRRQPSPSRPHSRRPPPPWHAHAHRGPHLCRSPPDRGCRFGSAKIDLAGVLDRQHMPADHRRAPCPGSTPQPAVRPSPPPLRGQAHGVGEKAIELDLQPPFPVSYPTQTPIAGMHHPFEQRSPLFQGGDPQNQPSAISIGLPPMPIAGLDKCSARSRSGSLGFP